MANSTHIYLPKNIRANFVPTVCGILAGHGISESVNSSAIYANGIKTENLNGDGFRVIFTNNSNKVYHYGHFYYDVDPNYYFISGGSNEFWNRLGKALVEFYGGYVDYDDCDDIESDFANSSRKCYFPFPVNDTEWDVFWKQVKEIQPIMILGKS